MNLTRRNMIASTAAAGAALFAARGAHAQRQGVDAMPNRRQTIGFRMTARERHAAAASLLSYFTRTAPELLRPAHGILRHGWISPSLPKAAYTTQLWDWDTYWTSRGLFRISHLIKDPALHRKVAEHAQGSLLNFLDHQSHEGRIPIMIDASNPDPFGSLKADAPNSNNQAKPIFSQLALLISDELGNSQWLEPYFDRLILFYDSWILGNQASPGLLVWGNDVAIGDDNDPTTFGRPFFSSANLMLNCLYFQDLMAASELARRLNRPQQQKRLSSLARQHQTYIQQYCWDPRDRFYYTVDVDCVDRRAELIPEVPRGMPMSWKCLPLRIQMFTGFLPMWCGISSQQQAHDLVHLHYCRDETFRCSAGVRSLSAAETMYSLARSSNPSNWLGPVWIIVNYFVWKGLGRYGFRREANCLSDKTLHLLASDLAGNGSLNEYYDPDTGAPLSHKRFMDWNMLVTEMM